MGQGRGEWGRKGSGTGRGEWGRVGESGAG